MEIIAIILAALGFLIAAAASRRAAQSASGLDALQLKAHGLERQLEEERDRVTFLKQALQLAVDGKITREMVEQERLFHDVSADEAVRMVREEPAVLVVDVRTPAEFGAGHIENAVNHPIQDIEKSYRDIPRDRRLLVYCAGGVRSAAACKFLTSKRYVEVFNFAEGFGSWPRT